MRRKGLFYLSQDSDSHWFIIPLDRAAEWDFCCESGGERTWEWPKWAIPVDGSYERVSFRDPQVDR